jgi:hypothetical protein
MPKSIGCNSPPLAVPYHVRRVRVLVDHALAVQLLERCAQLQRDVEEIRQRQRGLRLPVARPQHPVEGAALDIFLQHGPAPAVQLQRQWPHDARRPAAMGDRVLALEWRQLLKSGKPTRADVFLSRRVV